MYINIIIVCVLQINSYMQLSDISCVPDIHWSITAVNISQLIPFTDFVQPNTSVLRLEPFTLDPGFYVVSLEVAFPSFGANRWATDFLVLQILLPDLVAHIVGGDFVDVPHGGVIHIDASLSRDPAENVTAVQMLPITGEWSMTLYNSYPLNIEIFLKDFLKKDTTPPAGGTNYQITSGTEYILEIDTTLFSPYTYAMVLFTLSRGTRTAKALQFLYFIPNAIPLGIE